MTEEDSPSIETEEISAPSTEAKEDPTTDVNATDLDTQDVDSEDTAEDDGLEDYEYEGKKARIPKELIPRLMKDADYTQKTQALAEERRAVEAAKEQASKAAEYWQSAPKELVDLQGRLSTINHHLEEWKRVDFNQLALTEGEDAASREFRRYQQIKDQAAGLAHELNVKGAEFETQRQTETAKRLEETAKHARTLKGWTPEVDKEIAQFIEQKGISRDWWLRNASPKTYEMLHLAYLGAKVQQTATKTQAKPPPPQAAPVPPAPNRAPPSRKSLESMGMEDYIAARKAGRKS